MRFAVFVAAVVFSVCSHSISLAGTKMQVHGNAFAPPAFKNFCARERALCSTRGSVELVKLTPQRRAQLISVNEAVNRRINARSDLATTGKADDWRVPTRYGDCEDFAILKKKELIRMGWPSSALLLTVVRSGGEGHTVLTARTTAGDLILDSRMSAIRDWSRTPYRYFARQSQFNGRSWERIRSAQPL